ncbi:MAG: trimethylamine methyltransferase family protein [Candidatus Thorarchaeota archaeon]
MNWINLSEMTRLAYLTKDKIEDIHSTTLQLLEGSGVRVTNQEAKGVLEESGCIISDDIVKIPERLVKECLKSVPSTFSVFSRDGSKSFAIGEENVLINPGSSAAHFKDRTTGAIRKGTSEDIMNLVKVVEHLEHIQLQSTALVPSDVPMEVAGFYRLYTTLKHSTKPVVTGAFTKDDFSFMREILEIVSGGAEEHAKKPQAIFDCCPTSPLSWTDTGSKNLIDCAKADIPAQIVPAPLMGVSSPVTIAGTLVQQNMEILSGVAIAQLVNPGTPIIYGGAIGAFDMRYGTPRFSAVESTMTACMSNEIGKSYGIPTHAYLGTSESKIEDSQSGYETGLGLIMGILARINVISGPGLFAQLNCLSLEKLVIDNEYCGSALRLMKDSEDISTDEISDLIIKVGPGGDYLKQKHTMVNYRTKHLFPSDILSRLNIQSWIEDGQKTTVDQARIIVDDILKKETTPILSQSVKEKLDKVYADAKKHLS